jgi:hypothetical protein
MPNEEVNEILGDYRYRRLVIKVRFNRNVETFAELARLSSALQTIDALTRTDFSSDDLRLRRHSINLRARIINFYVGSPPEVTVLTTFQWITIFVAVLALLVSFTANYDKLKKNIPDIAIDIGAILSRIRGLTGDQVEVIGLAAKALIDDILRLPEDQLRAMADRIGRVRRDLIGIDQPPPSIDALDVDRRIEGN